MKSFNKDSKITTYPGSVVIAEQMLRSCDRGLCFELHPADFNQLQYNLSARNFYAHKQDGFLGLKASLPPREARALILIDPSYEVKTEYNELITALKMAYKKFSHGVYMVWYPVLDLKENVAFRAELKKLPFEKTMQVELPFSPLKKSHFLKGSGLFIINPPYILEDQVSVILAYLKEKFL